MSLISNIMDGRTLLIDWAVVDVLLKINLKIIILKIKNVPDNCKSIFLAVTRQPESYYFSLLTFL